MQESQCQWPQARGSDRSVVTQLRSIRVADIRGRSFGTSCGRPNLIFKL